MRQNSPFFYVLESKLGSYKGDSTVYTFDDVGEDYFWSEPRSTALAENS
jgi:hypothetical protein